jgi:hypothetical protein
MIEKGKIELFFRRITMKQEKTGLLVIGLLLVAVIGISIWSMEPTEDILTEAIVVANEKFTENSVEVNSETDELSMYVPESFVVVEESPNNVILSREEQQYILFYNSFEPVTSKLNYEAASKDTDSLVLESFEENDRFGYIYITSEEANDKALLLQIGVGGVKITTISSKNEILYDVEQMMLMANSIAYKDK